MCPSCYRATQVDAKICSNCGETLEKQPDANYLSSAEENNKAQNSIMQNTLAQNDPTVLKSIPGSYPEPKPYNYLPWAILVSIFGFLPLGIIAVIYAISIEDKWQKGDIIGAVQASKKAKAFTLLSIITALVLLLIYAISLIIFILV